MNTKELISLIEKCGYEVRSYSGRGMYGKKCVGVEISIEQSAFQLATQIAREAVDQKMKGDLKMFLDDLADLRVYQDSMGCDIIVYFPDVDWVKPIPEKLEEEK